MSKIEEIKQELEERGLETDKIHLFAEPAYENAVIGITEQGNVCYNYEKMVECLMEEDGMDAEEAADFIGYNTIRALDYMRAADADEIWPIIIYDLLT